MSSTATIVRDIRRRLRERPFVTVVPNQTRKFSKGRFVGLPSQTMRRDNDDDERGTERFTTTNKEQNRRNGPETRPSPPRDRIRNDTRRSDDEPPARIDIHH